MRRITLILGMVAAIFSASPSAAGEETPKTLAPPSFSHSGGFYTAPFSLSLGTATPNTSILYTLDGSEPSPLNTTGVNYFYKNSFAGLVGEPAGSFVVGQYGTLIYSQPLPITNRTGQTERLAQRSSTWDRTPNYLPEKPIFQGTVVRARTIGPGSVLSPVVTHTYFVTPQGNTRYSLPVLALTIQEDHLFEYEDGIHTAGIDFDTWRNANPQVNASGTSPANFQRRGADSEFPMHMEIMLPGEGRVFSQNLGVRIHGGNNTRAAPQKALRVYARNEYDGTNEIAYPLFPGLTERLSGEPLESFRRVLLRNSGQDHAHTRLRDAFVQTLVAPMGVDYQAYEPAVHFINGEFWGLINIRERLDQFYLGAHYGLDPAQVAIIENAVEIDAGTTADRDAMLQLRIYAAQNDLRNSVHFDHMAARMDLDNFLLYNIVQIYTNNTDWPGNNRLAWRVSGGAPGGSVQPGDGRWRWLIFDLDTAFGPDGSGGHQHNTLAYATSPVETGKNPPWSTVKLLRLLENETFRNRFINLFADHMNTTFRPARVSALVDELHARIAPHLEEHADRWTHTGDTSPQFLKTFGNLRPAFMRQHIVDYFDLDGAAEVRITLPPSDQARVRINSIELEPAGSLWIGHYFQGVPIEIEVTPAEGYTFVGWQGGLSGEGPLAEVTLDGNLTVEPIVQAESITLAEVILPRFMQGATPDNDDRVPFVCRLRIEGLLPNAPYRYANRVVTADDPLSQNGAGNAIYFDANTGAFFRTTDAPDFSVPGTFGEFVTNVDGVYTGWFIIEPSGNARFGEPEVFIRVLLNDGMGGGDYEHFLTTTTSVQVLGFGTGPGQATGLYGDSPFSARNIILFHDDPEGDERPLAATLIESAGFMADERYATFYDEYVSGGAGRFGSLLPNTLPGGLVRIEERDRANAQILRILTAADGQWPVDADTVNPTGGLDAPIALTLELPDLPSDINGDGFVDAVDVQLAINAALGIPINPAYDADINGDGEVNAIDVQLVINAALGVV